MTNRRIALSVSVSALVLAGVLVGCGSKADEQTSQARVCADHQHLVVTDAVCQALRDTRLSHGSGLDLPYHWVYGGRVEGQQVVGGEDVAANDIEAMRAADARHGR